MSSNKRFRTRTVVPNAGGLTDFIAGSSIQTWIVPAAAIDASFASNTGVLLDKKVKPIKLCQEIIKVREWIPNIGPLTKEIPLKLFLGMVPSSSADITRALRGCFREESVYMYVVSF